MPTIMLKVVPWDNASVLITGDRICLYTKRMEGLQRVLDVNRLIYNWVNHT